MIEIRKLTIDNMHEEIKLKYLCCLEELGSLLNNRFNIKKEFNFEPEWMNTAKDNNETRLLFGAYITPHQMNFIVNLDIMLYAVTLN